MTPRLPISLLLLPPLPWLSLPRAQVKSEDGSQTYIIKLQYDDTVASLRKYIDAHRVKAKPAANASPAGYEIRTSFPSRAYNEPHESLRQAGLVPNATLFLKPIKS